MVTDRIGIYAGSFDPLTKGHIWVIEKGIELFDHLYIAVGVNPAKQGYFPADERIEMINEYLTRSENTLNATAMLFSNEFLVDICRRHGCKYMLRGIRNTLDFAYEMEIKEFNDRFAPDIETIFVVPPKDKSGISSSLVRGCVGLLGWEQAIKDYATEHVIQKLKEHHENFSK